MNIGIVVSEFNYDITMMMQKRAEEQAKVLDITVKKIIQVPGVFDMPLAVKKLLEQSNIDGVVTIGAVIKGETGHDELVIQHASRKIADLALEFNKPVALGITGPGMSRAQAQARVDRAKDAVESVYKLYKKFKELEED